MRGKIHYLVAVGFSRCRVVRHPRGAWNEPPERELECLHLDVTSSRCE